ncbi:MAG: hypothetical protein K2X44_06260, partial [Magnetospirillum sp.]|nr:hypothetical protein [Magnetospirillum sp.]
HGHWADASTIRKAMERFMRNALTGNVDKQHNWAKQDAWVVECWTIRKDDPLFPDEPEGSWAAGVKVLDPDLWKSLKAGQYTGFSLAGYGELQPPPNQAPQAQPSWLDKFLKSLETIVNKKDDAVPMTPEEQAAMAATVTDQVIKALETKGLIKSAPPADQPQANADLAKTMEALAKAVEKMPETMSDLVAKAVAKGVTEGNLAGGADAVESYL